MPIFPTDHDCMVKSTILESRNLGAHTKKRLRVCKVCSRIFSTIEIFKGTSTTSDKQNRIVVKIDKIINTVCEVCEVSRIDLLGKRRNRPLVIIRQVTMYLCHESGYNYAEIGEVFDRHYSTVISSCKIIKEEKETNLEIKQFLLLVKFHRDGEDARQIAQED